MSKIDIVDLLELARAEILRLRAPTLVEYEGKPQPIEKSFAQHDVSSGWNTPLRLRMNALRMSAVELTDRLGDNGVTKSSEQVRRYVTGASVPSEEIKSHISSIVAMPVYDIWPKYAPTESSAAATVEREKLKKTHLLLTKARQDAFESRQRQANVDLRRKSPLLPISGEDV